MWRRAMKSQWQGERQKDLIWVKVKVVKHERRWQNLTSYQSKTVRESESEGGVSGVEKRLWLWLTGFDSAKAVRWLKQVWLCVCCVWLVVLVQPTNPECLLLHHFGLNDLYADRQWGGLSLSISLFLISLPLSIMSQSCKSFSIIPQSTSLSRLYTPPACGDKQLSLLS